MTAKNILIVDDEPHVIRILRLTLEREGYRVESACDGTAALQKLRNFDPDVMISDIQMPGMDGRALCRTVRATYARPFLILVMTSMTAIEERDWVNQLAATEFLEKPVSARYLVKRLADYFATQTATPSSTQPPSPEDRHA